MSLDAERNENMGRPKGSVSIYDGVRRGPQTVHVHALPRLRARHAGAREVQLLGGAT